LENHEDRRRDMCSVNRSRDDVVVSPSS